MCTCSHNALNSFSAMRACQLRATHENSLTTIWSDRNIFRKWFIIIVEINRVESCVCVWNQLSFFLVTDSVSYYLVNRLTMLSILSVYGEQKWFSHKTVPCSEKCRKYDCITWYNTNQSFILPPFIFSGIILRYLPCYTDTRCNACRDVPFSYIYNVTL